MTSFRSTALIAGMLTLLASITLPAVASSQVGDESAQTTLYERMGGYDLIAAFVEDFFGRMAADPELQPLLGGINAAEGARIHQHFVDFFCARTGGPCLYHGRSMSAAHEGLPITDDHFGLVVGHMEDTLEDHGVARAERAEIMGMVRDLRDEIVAPGG